MGDEPFERGPQVRVPGPVGVEEPGHVPAHLRDGLGEPGFGARPHGGGPGMGGQACLRTVGESVRCHIGRSRAAGAPRTSSGRPAGAAAGGRPRASTAAAAEVVVSAVVVTAKAATTSAVARTWAKKRKP
ncbi:hypothetical protein OEIGOIKO_05030 [Streptomyces chrestomyceticus JCM 4735]|uniref:Uncharacterized protein n=1 Tax=Streptomyces chrestomyceticus JCM 4735 TaxID=1306181 RepID=A0A7U9KXK4_9ACTN|nr:hypothetical protein OEIGOIKO_05030 [Streptomyces chrestomyceticus JCM 4735]